MQFFKKRLIVLRNKSDCYGKHLKQNTKKKKQKELKRINVANASRITFVTGH